MQLMPILELLATGVGLPILTSTDRTAWTNIGVVWPDGAPSDTNQFTGTTNGCAQFNYLVTISTFFNVTL